MAQTAQRVTIQEQVDLFLDYLLRKWGALPELAAEWGTWDDDSKVTFALNWGVSADRLHSLQQWSEMDLFTPEQRIRYNTLMALVARYQATLDHLLSDDS